MKKALLALMFLSVQAFASDIKPASDAEMAKLTQLGQSPKLGECMIVYKFDFFSDQLGFTIDGVDNSDEAKLAQFRLFLNTGKLEVRDRKEKGTKELYKHCSVVAQTVVEMVGMKVVGKLVEDGKAPGSPGN